MSFLNNAERDCSYCHGDHDREDCPHPESRYKVGDYEAMIAAAKNYVMPPDEREAQRKSWVVGETMLEHPSMTREQAEAIVSYAIWSLRLF